MQEFQNGSNDHEPDMQMFQNFTNLSPILLNLPILSKSLKRFQVSLFPPIFFYDFFLFFSNFFNLLKTKTKKNSFAKSPSFCKTFNSFQSFPLFFRFLCQNFPFFFQNSPNFPNTFKFFQNFPKILQIFKVQYLKISLFFSNLPVLKRIF